MTFKMDTNKAWFIFGMLLAFSPEARCNQCFANPECGCIPDSGSGGSIPLQPLKWSEFENLFVEGRSLEYQEVYNLKPPGTLPDLSKLIVQWIRAENETYFNAIVGWFGEYSSCSGTIMIPFSFEQTVRFHEDVIFTFATPLEGVPNVGTLFSSCPERYLINWYCPAANFDGQTCFDGLQMSLTTTTGPENIPWHLVSKDMCRNGIPYIDDPRWFFTYTGPQCELESPSLRKKRDADTPRMPNWP